MPCQGAGAPLLARRRPVRVKRDWTSMLKRIAVFAALVLCYVLTGVALHASQSDHMPAAVADSAN